MTAKQSLKPQDLSFPPTILSDSDDTSTFACGNKDIDYFIRKQALEFQNKRLGVTYLFKHNSDIIGFATLCMGHLSKEKMASEDRLPQRIPSYPALLIGQLAVCKEQQDNDIGTFICDFCLDRAIKLSQQVLGCRFLVVDSVEKAVKFYVKYGFVLAPKQEGEKQKLMFLDITKRKKVAVADFSGKTREGVRIKVRDAKSGKITRKYKYQEKISGDSGKEAKEVYDVDIAQNKYSHHVDEQDEYDKWKREHSEEESLTEHNKKKQSRKK